MARLNDNNPLYRDGSLGGAANLIATISPLLYGNPNSLYASVRQTYGARQGMIDAKGIFESIISKDGKIKETIKIITHSMGAAYAKGYVQSLLNYCKIYGIDPRIIEFEADFAPFQPKDQKAVKGVRTLQFSNEQDNVADNRILGSPFGPIQGSEVTLDKRANKGHGMYYFIDKILTLPTGDYKIVDGKIVAL